MTTKTLYDKIVDLHTIEKLSADGIESTGNTETSTQL